MEKQQAKEVLKVSSLNKRFMNLQAVNDISFSLAQGDIFAFLGPNGAGKTTTLRILLDIIKADSGRIEWNLNGKRGELPPAEHIGYLPEERGLYTDIPIIRSLVYLASIRGMNPAKAKTAAMEWLERLELADRAKEKLLALSKGNQQKIQFVASILHKPSFAILDEPFSGLDPLNQEKFIEYIREINQQGTTILLSAHQMSLVEKIADRVFLINQGRAVYNGSLPGIYDAFGKNQIIDLEFRSPVNRDMFLSLPGVELVNCIDEYRVGLTFSTGTDLNHALAELAAIEGISNISSHKPGLHEIFLKLVKNHQ
ncbi:MAG: ATP-binding cassette domain-containing protein [Bacteroidota bacterium]